MQRLVAASLLMILIGACTPSTRDQGANMNNTNANASDTTKKTYTKPSAEELKARLTPLQFEVTQNAATEPPFRNTYWNNHQDGIYVDVATGEPLFSSRDKFESGTGWPSFTQPIEKGHVVEHSDNTLGMERVEVISKAGGSHLGHVFDDGPAPMHKRYCMNSASLRFIPASELAAQGYGEYASLFSGPSSLNKAPPPDATNNACALPPPGKKAGCATTLEVAVFKQVDGDDRIAKPEGVLEVVRGFEGAEPAVEVTFDPAKLSYADLLKAWTKGREQQSKVFARDDAQKEAASKAGALHVVKNASPFRRENET